MSIKKIKAKKENCLWFYYQGWRYGKIIKRYAENLVTVRDCTKKRYRIKLNRKNQWIAISNKEFKGANHLKGKTNGKIKIKIKKSKGKKGVNIKTKKRRICIRYKNSTNP